MEIRLARMKAWYREFAEKYGAQLVVNGEVISTRAAATLIGKGKTVATEFLRWYRSEYHPGPTQADAPELLTEADQSKTWVDEKSGMVFTYLGPDYGLVYHTQGEFRSIRRDYSRLYGDKAMNQSEIAYKYKFPSAHAVDTFRRIHGWRQSSVPFTDAEFEEDGVEALVDKTLESKKQAYFLSLQEKSRTQDRADAGKWRAFELSARELVQMLSVAPLETPPLVLPTPSRQPYALVLGLTDIHIGKLCFDVHGRQIYDRRTAVTRALKAVQTLLRDAIEAKGTPDRIYLLSGSDNLHVDNLGLMTTAGTHQAGQSDGDYRSMVADYIGLMRQIIQTCMTVALTEVVEVEGNHDRASTGWLGFVLEEALRGNPRGLYTRQRGGLALVNYGQNSLIFLHGDNFKLEDSPRLALVAARERGLDLKPKILVFSGDKHHEQVKDVGGVKVHGLPSLSPSDDWHRLGKYIGSEEEMQAFVIRASGGKANVLYTDPLEICA